jgi:hypothetical protein
VTVEVMPMKAPDKAEAEKGQAEAAKKKAMSD